MTSDTAQTSIPYGYCHCGCGQKTTVSPFNNSAKGYIKGTPRRFLPGHNNAPFRRTLADAFWAYCTRRSTNECWEWEGPSHRGYGFFKWNGQKYFAHRVAFELHNGPIPKAENPRDASICHTCDNPLCCNPAHLFLGTQTENNLDMVAKGRHADVRGSKNPSSKLTEDNVGEIRELHAEGMSGAAIARRFGVSKELIYGIVQRKSWTHVP